MAEENVYTQTKEWLIAELTRRELDVDAYGEYLMSFLVPETSPSEIIPDIVDVLGAVIPEDAAKEFGEALVKEWEKELKSIGSKSENQNAEKSGNDLENAILKVIEEEDEKIAQAVKDKEATEKSDDDNRKEEKRELTEEEKAIKAKVLAQYGGIEVDIDLSDKKSDSKSDAYVNPNVAAVAAEKQKYRDQQKAAHEAKQQEIKRSQENQKNTREEKKAKRRAACQKGERRR